MISLGLWLRRAAVAAGCLLAWMVCGDAWAQQGPVKIGFSLGLTGANAPNGAQLLEALEIWRADVNSKGGLLGRQVEFVYYDDQTQPTNEPVIYTKLVQVDKVDLLLGPHGTNQISAVLPILAQRKLTTIGLLGTGVNYSLKYPNYFSMIPLGEDPRLALSAGFFEIAAAQSPRPQTVALVGADAEYGKNAAEGARENAKKAGLKIVYDKLYPPPTTDFSPIVRAVQATNPDVVFIAAYPPDTVGVVRAVSELGYRPKMIGGTLIGMQATPLKVQMGPLMNGWVNLEIFVPTFEYPGLKEMLQKYRAVASSKGIDPLGVAFVPFGYAAGQVLGQAVEATKSLDHQKIADYMRSNKFATVVGDIEFGQNGEWKTPRLVFTQWQGLTGSDLAHLNDPKHQVVVWPDSMKTGKVVYPYTGSQK